MHIKYSVRTGVTKIKSRFANTKRTLALGVAGAGLAVALPVAAFAYGGSETNTAQCDGHGKVVVNVNYSMVNDYDSGVGTPTPWANDTINRHLQIFQVGTGSYCAVVSDEGSFVTFDSTGPAGTGHVSAGVTGRISGGYRTPVFSGTLASTTYGTKGQLGSFNLQCTDAYVCEGARPKISSYVSGWNGDQAWWGWQYKTAQNGTWTNAIDVPGTSVGNITD
jgi:hypothetical protein